VKIIIANSLKFEAVVFQSCHIFPESWNVVFVCTCSRSERFHLCVVWQAGVVRKYQDIKCGRRLYKSPGNYHWDARLRGQRAVPDQCHSNQVLKELASKRARLSARGWHPNTAPRLSRTRVYCLCFDILSDPLAQL